MSEWEKVSDRVWDWVGGLASRQVANYTVRQFHGRTKEKALADTHRGLIAEVRHNQHRLAEWLRHWEESHARRDDGGRDDEKGRNVKAIKPGDQYVFVSDCRAKEYVVYEVDEIKRRMRYRGVFNRSDLEKDQMPDGRKVRRIPLEKLR